jgi:hypothetical protein
MLIKTEHCSVHFVGKVAVVQFKDAEPVEFDSKEEALAYVRSWFFTHKEVQSVRPSYRRRQESHWSYRVQELR